MQMLLGWMYKSWFILHHQIDVRIIYEEPLKYKKACNEFNWLLLETIT